MAVLSLTLQNKWQFTPTSLVLKEGLSKLYKAQLKVQTATFKSHADMIKNLLDTNATIEIYQSSPNVSVRYLHGIVTEVCSLGISQSTPPEYCYVITIEPLLTRLRYNRVSKSFYGRTPVQIITDLLHGMSPDISNIKTSYSSKLMFDQTDTSDLDFLYWIMKLYGLSFSYVHEKPQGGLVGNEKIYFSCGDLIVQNKLYDANGNPLTPCSDYEFLKPNSLGIRAWSMSDGIGVDRVQYSAPYPDSNAALKLCNPTNDQLQRCYRWSRPFHNYIRDISTREVESDVELMLDAQLQSLQAAKSFWSGEGINIALMCGQIIKLTKFYGAGDNSVIQAAIRGTTLTVDVSPSVPQYNVMFNTNAEKINL